jgi:hypothetical protein
MDEYERLIATVRALVEQLHQTWIEKEACAKVALDHGATDREIEEAKVNAVADPQIQLETREQFSGMWEALENDAKALQIADLLGSLPPTDKPN